jgi:hypothetical protein
MLRRALVRMDHKGIEYQIVQTANPTGFKWVVHLDATKTRTGITSSRKAAIFEAQWAIDKALNDPRTK